MKKNLFYLIFLGIFLINLSFVSAWSDDGSLIQTIDGCNELNTTNAIYTLSQSITTTGTCLTVAAENITIDCKKWKNKIIYGNTPSWFYYGIYSNKFNTTIRNCEITQGDLADFTVSRTAVSLVNSNNSTIENSNFNHNSYGLKVDSSSNGVFTNLVLNLNTVGLFFRSNSNYNLISDIIITDSESSHVGNSVGIAIAFSRENNLNNIFVNNIDGTGIWLEGSSDNTLIDVTSNSNKGSGIFLYYNSMDNLLRNIILEENRAGIMTWLSEGNL